MTVTMSKAADPQQEILLANLKRFREEAGYNQQEAATAADIPIDSLRKYEKGENEPSVFQLERLAKAYGHALQDFFMEQPPPAKLDERPAFLFRTMPGVEVDAELVAEARKFIDDLNKKQREIREMKAEKKPKKKP